MVNKILDYGPHWMWPALDYFEDGNFQNTKLTEEPVDIIDSWDVFFTKLGEGILLVPKDNYGLWENEFNVIKALVQTKLVTYLTDQSIPLRERIWMLRWGIDDEKRIYGSSFFCEDDFMAGALESLDSTVPYSEDISWTRFGPKELLHGSRKIA